MRILTLRQLALSNLGSMRRKYAAFFFSSILAVTVFYLMASFVFHPDVSSGYVAQLDRVRRGLLVAECMIIVFSFFFVLYSETGICQIEEEGIWTPVTFGRNEEPIEWDGNHRTRGHWSNQCGSGSWAGDPPIQIPLDRDMQYVASHVSSSLHDSGARGRSDRNPVHDAVHRCWSIYLAMHLTPNSRETSPRAPDAEGITGVLTICSTQFPSLHRCRIRRCMEGHRLSLDKSHAPGYGDSVVRNLSVFAQSSVGILRILQNRVSFLYRNLNLLTIGDLVFRMKENAWVLASVAVLSAAVITATGTIYTAQATLLGDQERAYPHAMTFAVSEEADPQILSHNIREILQECQISVQEEVVLPGLWVQADGYGRALIVREHIFNRWATDAGRKEVSLEGTEAAMLLPFMDSAGEIGANRFPMDVSLGSKTVTVEAHPWSFARTNCLSEIQQLIVVDDAIFEVLATESSSEDRINFFSYEFVNWQEAIEAGKRVLSLASDAGLIESASRLDSYEVRKQTNSLTAMIALFIASLFFIASGSLLYFRLFNEIREDREKYRMMEKLGVSRQEIRRVVTRQLLVFFFAPTVMGSVHCSFAMKALSNVLKEMPWPFVGVFKYGVAAVGGFSIIQVVYFLAARHATQRDSGYDDNLTKGR